MSCAEWAAWRKAPATSLIMKEWVNGYLTAFNRYGPQPNGNIGWRVSDDGRAMAIDNYCSAHPVAPIVEAIDHLIEEIQSRRPR